MLKLYGQLFSCYLLIITTGLERSRATKVKTTTIKPMVPFLDRFHQSDYKLTYDWAETVRANRRLGDYKARVSKYNRTTTIVNMTLFINHDFGYDVEVIAQAYRFASNEYRLFPLRFEVNFCEAVSKGLVGTAEFAKCGNISCPLLKGRIYTVLNWAPDETTFPPLIPTGKYMAELQFLYHDIEILVTRSYGTVYRPITVYEN